MRYLSLGLLVAAATLSAVPAEAQGGRDFGRGGAAGGRGAEFFLARTGELRLTDAQVVRLAAIARRSADRRRAMRASMDSIGSARRGARMDSADRAARTREMAAFRARLDRERDQARTDLRDAIAVLTPDQQAAAWDMAAGGSRGARGARGAQFRRRAGPGRERRQRGPEGRQPPDGQRPPQ
jgi:hypothetical protein